MRPMEVAAQLGLAGDALDRLADQVTHAHARADRAEAGAEAEREGLGGVFRLAVSAMSFPASPRGMVRVSPDQWGGSTAKPM